MPKITTSGIKYAGFALGLLLTGFAVTAHGGDTEEPFTPSEPAVAAVNSCQANDSPPASTTTTRASEGAAASAESAAAEAAACKPSGKRCQVSRPSECCSLACICPLGLKCTCG